MKGWSGLLMPARNPSGELPTPEAAGGRRVEGRSPQSLSNSGPFTMLLFLFLVLTPLLTKASEGFEGTLGSSCEMDQDCTVLNSRCNHGTCACLPYYATYNNSHCLQSTLLGSGCITSEQCWQKVANSSCAAGVCRCDKGFLQFRRHTCLSPAKLGDVCYSHTHCKMGDSNTQCDFLIPKLLGKCACKSSLKRGPGDLCLPSTATVIQYKHRPSKPIHGLPLYPSGMVWPRGEEGDGPVSLGLPCLTDGQCQGADPNTVCRAGICDCTTNNATCSAARTGCHKGTFQCRGSGKCISWYMVCNGRRDCEDGSDEECKGGRGCPRTSFRCARSRPQTCVSSAARCNGVPDCPAAEDEANCRDKANRGCPRGTFRCKDGTCLPGYEFCNAILSCKDGSDEPEGACRVSGRGALCPFRCDNGLCRSTAIACSGKDGCGDNSDEEKCQVCKCPTS